MRTSSGLVEARSLQVGVYGYYANGDGTTNQIFVETQRVKYQLSGRP